jgi:hypothetical protein
MLRKQYADRKMHTCEEVKMDRTQKIPPPEYTEDASVVRIEQLEVGVQAQVTGTTAFYLKISFITLLTAVLLCRGRTHSHRSRATI